MKFTQSLPAFALVCAMTAGAARADNVFTLPSPLTTTPYTNVVTVTAGNTFTLPNTGATEFNFTDTYNFSIFESLTLASTTVTVNLDLGNLGFHISNLKLDLFTLEGIWLDGDIVTDANDIAVSLNSVLAPGDYQFKVRGFADGAITNQGIYTFAVAAVPEADTYAMLLAGLGLVGFMARRRCHANA